MKNVGRIILSMVLSATMLSGTNIAYNASAETLPEGNTSVSVNNTTAWQVSKSKTVDTKTLNCNKKTVM